MGIVQKTEENHCIIAIWDVCESLDELKNLSEQYDLSALKSEKRKKEFLASRLLLEKIHPNTSIIYNRYGAPTLSDGNFVSISHSKNLVAITVSDKKVGLDIEQISEKALRLSSRFIAKDNHQKLTLEKATLIWCCKEAIFKWHQKGGVDFKKDICLTPFILSEKGEIAANFKQEQLKLNYRKINNHYLVYVCK